MNLSKIFETVFESAPDGLMLVDDQGLIRIANLQITKLFGYEKAELIGREVEILMPDCYANSHRALRKEYAVNSRSREMGAGKSLLARRKDGSEFYAEISLSPVILNGRFFVSTAIRDVTEKKWLLEKILKHEEKIEDQNKRLLNFAHMVSHNLRSYGSNIITMVSFLERTEDKVAREEITLHLKKMADSLNDTVHHLSEVAAIQSDVSLKRQNIRVFSYVEKTMEVLSGEINRAHVAIHNLVAPGLIVSYNPLTWKV